MHEADKSDIVVVEPTACGDGSVVEGICIFREKNTWSVVTQCDVFKHVKILNVGSVLVWIP